MYLEGGVEAVLGKLGTELQGLSLKFEMLGIELDHVMRVAFNA